MIWHSPSTIILKLIALSRYDKSRVSHWSKEDRYCIVLTSDRKLAICPGKRHGNIFTWTNKRFVSGGIVEVYFRCSLAIEIFLFVNPLLSSDVATGKIKDCFTKESKTRKCKIDASENGDKKKF